jgi:REP element-mobilizing transposase RayT
MPRRARLEVAPGVHHVYARGNDKQAIWADDVDRERYVGLLRRVTLRLRWRCLAYCLMPNHVHLLVETTEPNLGLGMGRIQGPYAQGYNERHDRTGHLFGGRYGAKRVTTDAQLWVNAAYIALNPVKAGLCRAAEDWRWSSHAATAKGVAPSWMDDTALMTYFSAAGGEPRQRYRAFVEGRGI